MTKNVVLFLLHVLRGQFVRYNHDGHTGIVTSDFLAILHRLLAKLHACTRSRAPVSDKGKHILEEHLNCRIDEVCSLRVHIGLKEVDSNSSDTFHQP